MVVRENSVSDEGREGKSGFTGADVTPDRKVRVSLVYVTPLIAAQMMDHNASNRQLKRTRIKSYAADMSAGRWVPFSSMLVFVAGRLADGQHRLNGVIESGIPEWFVLLERTDAQGVYDIGGARTYGDLVRATDMALFEGLAPTDVSPVIRAMAILDLYIGIDPDVYRRRTRLQEVELLRRYPAATAWAARVRRDFRRINRSILNPAYLAGMIACYRVDAAAAQTFFEDVVTGQAIFEDEPSYRLRQHLLGNTGTVLEMASRVVYAYNAWVDGRKPARINGTNDRMPEPKRRQTTEGAK